MVPVLYNHVPFFKEYREPMVGGGTFFLYLRSLHYNKNFWINDLDYRLYCFWKTVRDKPYELVEAINQIIHDYKDGRDLFEYANEKIDSVSNEFDIAVFYYILNRISFNGAAQLSGFSSSSYNNFMKSKALNKILQNSILLRDVKITNMDYADVLLEEGDDVFAYLDPPYFDVNLLYGINGVIHKNFDHNRFKEICDKTKHKILITYNQHKYIEELFSQYVIIREDLFYSMTSDKRKVTNLIIKNY